MVLHMKLHSPLREVEYLNLDHFLLQTLFYSASGLIPDVDYTLSIVAISGSERSTPVTVNVTTLPAGETVRVCYIGV